MLLVHVAVFSRRHVAAGGKCTQESVGLDKPKGDAMVGLIITGELEVFGDWMSVLMKKGGICEEGTIGRRSKTK
jgi:hypothetical protein